MVFVNGVKNIQAAAYNGACTVSKNNDKNVSFFEQFGNHETCNDRSSDGQKNQTRISSTLIEECSYYQNSISYQINVVLGKSQCFLK